MNNGKGEIYSGGSERRVGLGNITFNAILAFLHQGYSGMGGKRMVLAMWRIGDAGCFLSMPSVGNYMNSAQITDPVQEI